MDVSWPSTRGGVDASGHLKISRAQLSPRTDSRGMRGMRGMHAARVCDVRSDDYPKGDKTTSARESWQLAPQCPFYRDGRHKSRSYPFWRDEIQPSRFWTAPSVTVAHKPHRRHARREVPTWDTVHRGLKKRSTQSIHQRPRTLTTLGASGCPSIASSDEINRESVQNKE